MISCHRIKQFLSANVDEHASHFMYASRFTPNLATFTFPNITY
jgi:hypothetical protein